ncbi:hypothetical protein [Bacillus sp. FJAT-22090]|uniref:hypothetical protein n=1 Tax=Bacillus sp. FJAT-22090 TaxID=1581038 RepID=UPI00119E4886|nr:hypothetical protein [Bacillus sp. FJAT-22090]
MCKGTSNGEEVHIINVDKIPNETFERLNKGWITNHGGIPVDKCIGEEVEYLVVNGVVTLGSCCGHGEYQSHILADKSEKDKLLELGYESKPFRWEMIIANLKSGTQTK